MMTETQLQEELHRLLFELFGGPTIPIQQKDHVDLKKNLVNLGDSLVYLRICIKYLLLDLEATRRENEFLTKYLKDEREL